MVPMSSMFNWMKAMCVDSFIGFGWFRGQCNVAREWFMIGLDCNSLLDSDLAAVSSTRSPLSHDHMLPLHFHPINVTFINICWLLLCFFLTRLRTASDFVKGFVHYSQCEHWCSWFNNSSSNWSCQCLAMKINSIYFHHFKIPYCQLMFWQRDFVLSFEMRLCCARCWRHSHHWNALHRWWNHSPTLIDWIINDSYLPCHERFSIRTAVLIDLIKLRVQIWRN